MKTNIQTIKELDKLFFTNIMSVMNSTDVTLQFNNDSDKFKLSDATSKMLKEYMKIMDKLHYFHEILDNKEFMKSMKRTRRNLGEQMFHNIFKTILNDDYKNDKYYVEIKSVCPIDVLYDALVRKKTHKIPNSMEMVYMRIGIYDTEVEKYKIIFTSGKDISDDEYKTMENK